MFARPKWPQTCGQCGPRFKGRMTQLPNEVGAVVFDCAVTNSTKDGISLALVKAKLQKFTTTADITVTKGQCVQLK